MPFFSIVIPTLNSESCIEACLGSIVSQNCKDYEVLIYDAVSSDKTIEIINSFVKANPLISICVTSEKDKGIYDAMNKGLNACKGKWIYFLGSDDRFYDDNVLSDILPYAATDQYDIIYGSIFHEDFKKVYDGEFNYEKICRDGICHQGIFYRKEILLRYGGYRVDMKIYAHIYLDKILFTNENVRWKFIDRIIAFYAGRGVSRYNFDKVYWNEAETMLNEHFKNRVSKKIIYESLQPIVDYQFTFKSFLLSFRIAYYTHSSYPIRKWFKHPTGIARLTMKKFTSK